MDCKEATKQMHDALEGDLNAADQLALRSHLAECPSCRERYKQLEQTEALIRISLMGTRIPPCSERLTYSIMQALPASPRRKIAMKWLQRHPGISVAAVTAFLMMGSLMTLWNQGTELMVRGSDLSQVVIDGKRVVVPAGHTVNGNLLVENGEMIVEGQVKGNLVVVDGSVNLASTAVIGGEIQEIDQAIDWLWLKVNQLFEP
ncbi:zf-HC2 domain-containing protein [Paenibacillus sp. y28]|uniref:zf-HC2 domain-containing protein n=1 Tax=Paenibacillus sp. y28 TaxID=3129110 RepID=UPI003015DEAB